MTTFGTLAAWMLLTSARVAAQKFASWATAPTPQLLLAVACAAASRDTAAPNCVHRSAALVEAPGVRQHHHNFNTGIGHVDGVSVGGLRGGRVPRGRCAGDGDKEFVPPSPPLSS